MKHYITSLVYIPSLRPVSNQSNFMYALTLNLLAPTTVGARINP